MPKSKLAGGGCLIVIGTEGLVLSKGIPASKPWRAPGVVLLDESSAKDEEDLHHQWRRWLQLYNVSQFLPGMLLATAGSVEGHDYDALEVDVTTLSPAQPSGQAAMNGAWQEVLKQSLAALVRGLTTLVKMGAPVPEVGMELANDRGHVLADAELAWAGLSGAWHCCDRISKTWPRSGRPKHGRYASLITV